MASQHELKPSDLRFECDPQKFHFKDTSEVEPLDRVIGQERAVLAIDFGLNMKSPGYNIFVTGIEGTGKATIVKDIVAKFALNLSTPNDWCMVNNFRDEYRPKPIAAAPGQGIQFSRKMNGLINDLKRELPKAFENKNFLERQSEVQNKYTEQKEALLEKLEKSAKEKNLQINRTKAGYQAVPVFDKKAMTKDEFQKLPEKAQEEIKENIREIHSDFETTERELNRINLDLRAEVERLMEEVTLFVVKNRLGIIREEYKDNRDILVYLDEVQTDIVENMEHFVRSGEENDKAEGLIIQIPKSYFDRYKVNVLVDQTQTKGAPVVFETNPTYQNIFGQIEKRAYMGTVSTDFTMIQSGSLLKANGGFLIMEVESVLMSPLVWSALKRALQNKQLFIEDMPTGLGYGSASLRPEPIPLEVKVILLGRYEPFQLLQNHDPKFNKIFRVRADFDNEVDRTDTTVQQYAQFISRVCKEEDLLPFTPNGVVSIVEYGEKYTSNKNKLSLRFGQIVGVIKEADYWARKDNASRVTDKHVTKAFNEYRFRYNLYEEKLHESYVDNTIFIDVEGHIVGQVNALAVYKIGDISFGRPSRITAEAYMGKEGVINIEREAKLSGKTHDKGILILSGYLGRVFAQKYPLSVSISVTFEQSYGGIDGDSASSTELYAILSSLSGIPIHQGIAVTGSVNQKGEIQAIGGVNQKIEGFFEVCKSKRLTGKQGVLIPQTNVKNLMLKKEVIDAVKEGKFHIYQVSTVEEGIEILTGVPAGQADNDGNYPTGTVYHNVMEKLKLYLQRSVKFKKEFETKE